MDILAAALALVGGPLLAFGLLFTLVRLETWMNAAVAAERVEQLLDADRPVAVVEQVAAVVIEEALSAAPIEIVEATHRD